MIKHVIFLLFLYGIRYGDGSSSSSNSDSQQDVVDSTSVLQSGIKKNEGGANGLDNNSREILKNFRNPVLEYLLSKNLDRASGPPKKGIIREIRHSQTLLIPNSPGGGLSLLPVSLLDQLPAFQQQKKPDQKDAQQSPLDSFWNYLKNKTEGTGNKTHESVVTSQVVHLNKSSHENNKESTRVQVYPAMAVVIHTYNKDGTLKNSVTHFQPDFNSVKADEKEAFYAGSAISANKGFRNIQNAQHTVSNYLGSAQNAPSERFKLQQQQPRQGGTWPLGNYFPIVINDPFMAVYNAFASSMYNAVSSMVEYGPEADICGKDAENREKDSVTKTEQRSRPVLDRYQRREEDREDEPNFFDEVTMRSEAFRRHSLRRSERKRRDTTSIYLKTRQGDKVDITLEEPVGANLKPNGGDFILRKGGIAIAGPGGAATAYTGGTAIVGPYGTVYKSPEGTAIVGPFSRVVDITDDTTFEEILRMHAQLQTEVKYPIVSQQHVKRPSGVRFKNFGKFFSYITDLPIKTVVKPQGRNFNQKRVNILRLREDDVVKAIEDTRKEEFKRIVQDVPYEEKMVKDNETTLIFRPKSKAEAGRNGVALSAPTSHAILYPQQKAKIYFEPESVASAGPSGFAHAQSELFVSYVRNTTIKPELTTKKDN